MSPKLKDFALLAGLGLAGVAVIVTLIVRSLGAPATPGKTVLSSIPRDAFLVATLDVRAFGPSELAQTFFVKKPEPPSAAGSGPEAPAGLRALGLESLEETCGGNLLTRLREVALAVPEEGERGDFGLLATGSLEGDEVTHCATAMMAKRGDEARFSRAGSFTMAEDVKPKVPAPGDETPPGDPSSRPKLAFRDGGPFLVGRTPWLDALLAAAEGRAPSLLSEGASPAHASLREALTKASPLPPALLVTAVLPQALRDRLRGELDQETSGPSGGGKGPEAMGGVLGVASAGFAIHAGQGDAPTTFRAELRCDTEAACIEVEKLLAQRRFALSMSLTLRVLGLGPALDQFKTSREGAVLRVSTQVPSHALVEAVEHALGGPSFTFGDRRDRTRPHEPRTIPTTLEPAPAPPELLQNRGGDGKDAGTDRPTGLASGRPASKPLRQ